MDMSKTYNPSEFEKDIYKEWEEKGYFRAEVDPNKLPFTIVIPPPNITGQLHMGHALDETLQDTLIRFKRMQGYSALWLPGTDHASIATEVKIVEQMAKEGITKKDIGRDGFLKRAWAWKEKYGGRIIEQLKTLGSSCDWSRLAFTMDNRCSKAVKEVFVNLYEKGLIYRGDRIINWCPDCKTALSDAEVEYVEEDSNLWYIKYPLKDGSGFVTVATSRPETMLGDTAVAVNPKDKKYKDLIGKTLIIPIVNREIPIIADEYVELGFGTGAVKITPAHDPNDFEVGLRHNLQVIRVIADDGFMNENSGKYQGIKSEDCRKQIVEDLKSLGVLEKIEPLHHNVGHCYRCNHTVEPIVSKQWFVKMEPLAKPAIEVVRKKSVKFTPDRFSKIYFNWMENIKDWCISRQLWWGHRIPAYYCKDCGEMIISKEDVKVCTKCGSTNIVQDEDVLDTWFSSALWPFSTLGYPENTEDLKYFYPTDVLVTGYDIIFFWVARMITMGLEFTKKAPFSTVYIHGLIRDEKGQKMSKSKGNTIDPVQIIDKYGCDALRFTMTSLCTYGGQDIKISDERFEYGRNFANKIWNASRFVLMNLEGVDNNDIDFSKLTIVDKWILNELNNTAKEFNENIKNYRIGETAHIMYDFFWNKYCDWYVEIAKIQLQDEELKLNTQRVLRYVLDMSLRLLHPIMPHITEKVWQLIPQEAQEKAIMLSSFPVYTDELSFPKEAEEMELVFETIKSLRNVRQSFNIPTSLKFDIEIRAEKSEKATFEAIEAYIKRLAKVENISYADNASDVPKKSATAVVSASKIIIPLENLIDFNEEIKRQQKKLDKLVAEKNSLAGRMNNEKFVANAPKELIEQTKERIDEITVQETAINELINSLKA